MGLGKVCNKDSLANDSALGREQCLDEVEPHFSVCWLYSVLTRPEWLRCTVEQGSTLKARL